MNLTGRIALVTGATRGIGQAIARSLADAGARVIGTATSESGAASIATDLGDQGAGRVLDVADEASIAQLIEGIEREFGAVGILVNNAGITRDNLAMRMKESDWDEVMATTLKSVFRLSRAVMRGMMKARYGRIINISSVVGSLGNGGQVNYAAAKAGLEGFTRSLARELGSRAITVNAVAPGFIDTDMTRALSAAQRESLQAQIPLGRLGSPADVATAVAFLASDEAAYITGSTLHVNGGMYMG